MNRMQKPDSLQVSVRPVDPGKAQHIDLVAERMKATLVEVIGAEGETLYTQEWLRNRIRWHLRPEECTGEVLLAQDRTDQVVGHVILRVEADAPSAPLGLISTIYVLPSFRRAGIARALLDEGEAWLLRRQVATLATDTSETNMPLISLFEARGYAITFRSAEKRMVRLSRPA